MLETGKCYKVSFGERYFFGRLMHVDNVGGTYSFYDLRKGYEVVAPIGSTMVEPYEDVDGANVE